MKSFKAKRNILKKCSNQKFLSKNLCRIFFFIIFFVSLFCHKNIVFHFCLQIVICWHSKTLKTWFCHKILIFFYAIYKERIKILIKVPQCIVPRGKKAFEASRFCILVNQHDWCRLIRPLCRV